MNIKPIKSKVVINNRLYEYQLLPARKNGKISSKLMSKAIALMTTYGLTKNIDNVHFCIENFMDDETIEKVYDLIFSDEVRLTCDGKLIQDPDIFFQGKYMEMTQLCIHAFRSNCEDFFTFIGGFVTQNTNLSQILNDIIKSQETPTEIKNLLQSFLSKKEE